MFKFCHAAGCFFRLLGVLFQCGPKSLKKVYTERSLTKTQLQCVQVHGPKLE
jgi:hypothetical protein